MATAFEVNENEDEEIFITQNLPDQVIEISSEDDESIPVCSYEDSIVELSSLKKECILPIVCKDGNTEASFKHGCVDVRYIAGVQVHFPVKPYPSQIVLMNKVITGVKKRENCLLESPTGSGKTLALLCSALAWQAYEKENCRKAYETMCHSPLKKPAARSLPSAQNCDSPKPAIAPKSIDYEQIFAQKKFASIYQKILEEPAATGSGHQMEIITLPSPCHNQTTGLVTIHKRRWSSDVMNEEDEQLQVYRLTRVFYGARTHKQLAQAVAELKRTSYGQYVRMSVLASREHACIRPLDRSTYTSLNDMCRALKKKESLCDIEDKKTGGCEFYDDSDSLVTAMKGTWDLEQLVEKGRTLGACPYYAARYAAQVADVVFCPYNYLIDPEIRRTMKISLDDDVVILDEAHNIEEVCRNAASVNIAGDQIIKAINELDSVLRTVPAFLSEHVALIQTVLRRWDDWFHNHKPMFTEKVMVDGEAVHTWEITHFVTTLDNHNLGEMHYRDFQTSANKFQNCLMDEPTFLSGVTQNTGIIVGTIKQALGYLFRDSCKYMNDFKPALTKKLHYEENNLSSSGWKTTQPSQFSESRSSYVLQLHCMNPAVVFAELSDARCIVLSSGTLNPTTSMNSELGANFPHQYSARHVIPPDRVWIGSIHTSGTERLECTSRNMNNLSVQDQLGEVLLNVCSVTPGGVLCFLASYSRLNELRRRWNLTGLWRKLTSVKHVFMESKNMRDHDDIMSDYYERVSSDKGALLLAVYRGKVSEGMDFKDHQARAVVAVGIPYPNIGGFEVKSKGLYNDKHLDRGLLPSKEWLRVQAYRALNQAVGRCIRHRGDWGAVLLVDARFSVPYYTEHLSTWVREFLANNHHTLDSLIDSGTGLKAFMDRMRCDN